MNQPCPLCQQPDTNCLGHDEARSYWQCHNCFLVHVPSDSFLSKADELAVYHHHQNDVADQRYRDFLNRLRKPLSRMLTANSLGLDFGCGPGPALAAMLREDGHTVTLFDRFFHNDPEVLQSQYDFITATEVFEHLQQPAAEIARLWNCLKDGGYLGVMTKRIQKLEASEFLRWFYIRDPTHVIFFHEETFRWLARRLGAELQFFRSDVAILRKPVKPGGTASTVDAVKHQHLDACRMPVSRVNKS